MNALPDNPAIVTAQRPYYPSLDGLRAVAALMVFYEHYVSAPRHVFGWGWTGVDVFFVLSGFLITGILYDSQNKPHRFRDFYVRRSLRIFPIYYAVWLVLLLLAPLAQFQWNLRWLVWPAYVGNYSPLFFRDAAGDTSQYFWIVLGPQAQAWFGKTMHIYIGHFWSLCVEEQFYLVWPAMVYLVKKRETLLKICLASIVLVPVLRWLTLTLAAGARPLAIVLIYGSLPTRLDALLIGGAVALLLRGRAHASLHKWARRLLFSAAMFCLLASLASAKAFHFLTHGSTARWYIAISFTAIDLLAAAFLLESIHPSGKLGAVLRWKPLRALGLISYGFYVYHDLLHDFYSYFAARYFPSHPLTASACAALLGTLVLSTLSYLLLEKPMLRLKRRFSGQVHRAPTA